MTTQGTYVDREDYVGSSQDGEYPRLGAIVNIPVDVKVHPLGDMVGSKRDGQIDITIGGPAANGAPVAMANGVTCGLIGVQGGMFAGVCAELARKKGLRPHIIQRPEAPDAITVAASNGVPGRYDLTVQRMRPPTVAELTGTPNSMIASAEAFTVGPMPFDESTRALLEHVSDVARYKALIVHPSLLHDPEVFAELASRYDYCQMNLAEARVLEPDSDDIDLLAMRVHYLLGDDTEFAITNGDHRGLLWSGWFGHSWHEIQPARVHLACDVGAGDVFCLAYVIARRFFRATASAAVRYAVESAVARVSGTPIRAYGK